MKLKGVLTLIIFTANFYLVVAQAPYGQGPRGAHIPRGAGRDGASLRQWGKPPHIHEYPKPSYRLTPPRGPSTTQPPRSGGTPWIAVAVLGFLGGCEIIYQEYLQYLDELDRFCQAKPNCSEATKTCKALLKNWRERVMKVHEYAQNQRNAYKEYCVRFSDRPIPQILDCRNYPNSTNSSASLEEK